MSPGIWALGDCNGRGAFTHTSYNDFEIVAANLLDGEARTVNDRIAAYALYTDPPLGRAGMTEAEARQSGRRVLVASMAMEDVARAIEKGETTGLMKLVVDADTRMILGAAILGTGGDEVIHCILDLMYAGAPYTVLQRAMHIHPTVAEMLPSLAAELAELKERIDARRRDGRDRCHGGRACAADRGDARGGGGVALHAAARGRGARRRRDVADVPAARAGRARAAAARGVPRDRGSVAGGRLGGLVRHDRRPCCRSSSAGFDTDVARSIVGAPANLRAAGSLRPQGEAREVVGGYRVSGRWNFASGVTYADWLYCTCRVMDGDAPRLTRPARP